MLFNAGLSPLANSLLKGVPFVSIPNNPRNKKQEKKPLKYLFVSTKFLEKKDEAGVVHQFIQGTSCKRNPPKPLSKRDIHRSIGV